jgi:ribonuclease HI
MHQGTMEANEGEALGLKDALEWIENQSYHQIIIELDNQTVVKAMQNQTRVRKRWGSVVNCCISFLKANPSSSIAWVNRSRNHVAHELAKWAEMAPNKDWPNSIFLCITLHIIKAFGLFIILLIE